LRLLLPLLLLVEDGLLEFLRRVFAGLLCRPELFVQGIDFLGLFLGDVAEALQMGNGAGDQVHPIGR